MTAAALSAALLINGDLPAEQRSVCPQEPALVGSFQQIVNDIGNLRHRGCFPAAHDLAEALLVSVEHDYGTNSLEAALVLEILADSHYWLRERNDKAIGRVTRALEVRPSAQGHRILGSLLSAQGDPRLFPTAWQHFEQARGRWEEEVGFASLEIADLLNWIGELIDVWGVGLDPSKAIGKSVREMLSRVAAAVPEADREQLGMDQLEADPALTITRASVALARVVEPESAEYAEALNILGNLLHDRQRYDEALLAYDESLGVRLRFFPEGHPQIARAYHNRGEALMLVGKLDEAWPDLKAGYDLRLAVADSRYPATFATSLRALGQWLFFTGDLEGAIQHYLGALPHLERIYGHWRHAEALMNLAEVYEDLGRIDEARDHYEKALAVLAPGPDSNQIGRAAVEAKLGTLLVKTGELEEGRRFLHSAQSIQESRDQPLEDYAQTLRGLAQIARADGDPGAALELLRESATVLGRYQGSHPELAETLLTIAENQLELKDAGTAQTLDQVMALLPSLGEEAYARPRYHLLRAQVAAVSGRRQEGLDQATRAARIYAGHLRPAFRVLSPDSALRYAHRNRESLDLALALLSEIARIRNGLQAEDVRLVWETVARSRGLLVEEQRRRYQVARKDTDPGLRALLAELDGARQFLAEAQLRMRQIPKAEEREALLRYARARIDKVENALATKTTPTRLGEQPMRRLAGGTGKHVDWGDAGPVEIPDLIGALPSGTALIAFVRFGTTHTTRSSRYAAFVTAAGSQRADFVDLGPAEIIDELVDDWRATLLQPASFADWREAETRLWAQGAALRREVWDPVTRLAPEAQEFFIVPDGSLFLLPFAALAGHSEHRYLIEEGYETHYLVSERDLLSRNQRSSHRQRLLAIGGPDFDAGLTPAVVADLSRPSILERWRDAASDFFQSYLRDPCRGNALLDFLPLPFARDEATRVASIFNGDATELVADAATEAKFKQLAPDHSVLHIATHAFLDLECRRGTAYRGLSELLLDAPDKQRYVPGLAFAGANRYRLESEPDVAKGTAGAGHDGILIAPEIAALDLSEVDWVVLSACETAVGQVASGEGVLGLARAFRVAGADSLILSLWPVEDRATREWMIELYRARFQRHETTASSSNNASLAVLDKRRRTNQPTHPYFWAAFVAMGDWG